MISDVECIDNIIGMSKYPDRFFHLAVPDPNYGIGEAGKNHKSRNTLVRQKDGKTMRRCPSNNYTRKEWDNSPPPTEYFTELFRVSINQLIFGANYFKEIVGIPFKPPRRNDFDVFLLQYPKGWIIWDKCNGTSDFNDCELIWTSFDFPSYILKYMWAGMMQGKSIIEGNIMQGDKSKNEKRIHPTQKPIIIYRHLLRSFAEPGTKILDTHLGSQSSRIAAEIEGYNFYGFDNDWEYFDMGNKRFEQHKLQPTLF